MFRFAGIATVGVIKASTFIMTQTAQDLTITIDLGL
jgi:hypothetical protein